MIAKRNSHKYFISVYIYFLSFSIFIQGQEYDEAFMQSLPQEVRDQQRPSKMNEFNEK